MAGNTEQRELWCQLSPSHVAVEATFAKEGAPPKFEICPLQSLDPYSMVACLA